MAPFRTGALIATFRCVATARCGGAFVDERRVAGRRRRREKRNTTALPRSSGGSPKWSPRTNQPEHPETARDSGGGTGLKRFHRDAPARCGAFADALRVVAGEGGAKNAV
jgi:hypothetical protein